MQRCKRYGLVDMFNHAGVLLSGFCRQRSQQPWQRMLAVNFWGVLHGIKAFVPRMIEQGADGHIVKPRRWWVCWLHRRWGHIPWLSKRWSRWQ